MSATSEAYAAPEAMHTLATTVTAPACVLSDQDGQIRPSGAQGLYVSDVRVLRGARISINDHEPVGLGSDPGGPGTTTFYGFAPRLGDPSPNPTVRVDRTRAVTPDGMDEVILVRSTATIGIRATVVLHLDPDQTPLVVARSGRVSGVTEVRSVAGHLRWGTGGATVTASAVDSDLNPADHTARWSIALDRGDELALRWSLRVHEPAPVLCHPAGPPDWRIPELSGADPRLFRLVDRALADLTSMRLVEAGAPGDPFIAAGAPWFLTLFGRDSLWTAKMLLPLGTGLAETTLRALARRQGSTVNAQFCEEPGKIMHELRPPAAGVWRRSPDAPEPGAYYGTVDATPLWISLLADAWRFGMSADAVTDLLPHLRAALGWLAQHSDPTGSGSGFVSYLDSTGQGLANQGWKDSFDAIRFRGGGFADPPVALVEVQGYAHRAALDAAALLDTFDADTERADRWREYAAGLAARFRSRFWVDSPLGPHPALALDRAGRPVDSLTSNIGHLLGTGLLSAPEEVTVAHRLGHAALAGGYGLRTMSELDSAFDPMSYHCGSIWPHDTAIVLLGLATMRDSPVAQHAIDVLADGLLIAAETFEYRLPELYCGNSRTEAPKPLPHPAACRPQAWSAAAAVALLQACRADLAPATLARP